MADSKSTKPTEIEATPDVQLDFIPQGFGALSTEWELAELELDLMALADKMDPRSLKALQLWMSGHTKIECITMAGYNIKDMAKAATSFAALARRPEAKDYIDLCKRISTLRSMKELSFTDAEWLQFMRDAMAQSRGDTEQAMATFANGELVSGTAKRAEVANQLKALDMIAKQKGMFTEKLEVSTSNKATVSVKDFTRTSHDKALDEPEDD